jgi:ribonuclease HII
MSRSKKSDIVSMVIIEDDDDTIDNTIEDDDNTIEEKDIELLKEVFEIIPVSKRKSKIVKKNNIVEKNNMVEKNNIVEKSKRNIQQPLKISFDINESIIELGIDEAGRGPMFGRVYAGVVVLPKDDSFDHSQMKDSKKFHSKKKIEQVAKYIKENAIAWAVEYEDEQTIDEINILQATQSAMHKGIKSVLSQLTQQLEVDNIYNDILLLVDGNYFKPLTIINKSKTKMETIRYQLIEGGDNKFSSIAAASILAKVERDKYIDELCLENPELVEYYGINTNKGYGSKKHMDGIKQYGITKWHRKTFGICKEFC